MSDIAMLQQLSYDAREESDMITAMHLGNSVLAVSLLASVLLFTSCAYRLPAASPPSQERIRIVVNAPEQYAVQVNTGTVTQYIVPHDGRFKIGIPSYRPSCGVYLFDAIKVGGYSDPLASWSISVIRNGKTVHKLSLRAIQKFPTDAVGYRMVRFRD